MADKSSRYTGTLDFNVRAERMGLLCRSAPQLSTNPLTIAGEEKRA